MAAQQQQEIESGAAADGADSAAVEDALYGGEEPDAWENPYVTVQGGMVTLHVMLADANTSDLGVGGMLRPVGARRQDLNVRVSDLPAALNAVPQNSGRMGAWWRWKRRMRFR